MNQPAAIAISVTVNGRVRTLAVPPQMTLVRMLREALGLTGTKESCGQGECGACTVLMDGKAVNSCLVLAAETDGHEILTIEGLAANGELDPLQQAFLDAGAVQCGYCTPGMIMAAKQLLLTNSDPNADDVKAGLAGNLCRCTGYARIVAAVLAAAKALRDRGASTGVNS